MLAGYYSTIAAFKHAAVVLHFSYQMKCKTYKTFNTIKEKYDKDIKYNMNHVRRGDNSKHIIIIILNNYERKTIVRITFNGIR